MLWRCDLKITAPITATLANVQVDIFVFFPCAFCKEVGLGKEIVRDRQTAGKCS